MNMPLAEGGRERRGGRGRLRENEVPVPDGGYAHIAFAALELGIIEVIGGV